jgi:hypothetical protein
VVNKRAGLAPLSVLAPSRIYYILKHGLFVGGCMVTTVPSRICNETK